MQNRGEGERSYFFEGSILCFTQYKAAGRLFSPKSDKIRFTDTTFRLYTITMKAKEIIKLLKENGWECVRIKGSHHIFEKGGKIVPVPVHAGDLKRGTLNSILKMAGLK